MGTDNQNRERGAARNGIAPLGVSGPSCGYIDTIPKSPDVNFQLDNTNLPYEKPSGGNVVFELKCDVAFEDIEINGDISVGTGKLESNITHFAQTWVVGGRPITEDRSRLDSDVFVVPMVADATNAFPIRSESSIDVLIQVGGSSVLTTTIKGEGGHYPKVEINGSWVLRGLAVRGEIAGQVHIEGTVDLEGQTISGAIEAEDHPAVSGDNTLDITSNGSADVLIAINGIRSLLLDVIAEGKIDVLYNITGEVDAGPIKSRTEGVDVLGNIVGHIKDQAITSSGVVDFLGRNDVKGVLDTKEPIDSRGRLDHLSTITGSLKDEIGSRGEAEVRWFGWVYSEPRLSSDIKVEGQASFYPEVKVADANLTTNLIKSTGSATFFEERLVRGSLGGVFGFDSDIQHINLASGNIQTGLITGEGEAEHDKPIDGIDVRYVDGWIRPYGLRIGSAGVAYQINTVTGRLSLDDGGLITEVNGTVGVQASILNTIGSIGWLGGRITHGDDEVDYIDQIYEVSTQRSMDISEAPPDSRYAVRLNTTDFNISNEELRRGTATFTFKFPHDIHDIHKINVWLKTPNGGHRIDTMRWNNKATNERAPHVLHQPFRYQTLDLVVPVHCISRKANQFFIEIEYRDHDTNEVIQRSRTFKERESYIIPFQAHFDNQDPYVNIADHSKFEVTGGQTYHAFIKEEPKIIFLSFEDRIRVGGTGSNHMMAALYEEPELLFLSYEDRVVLSFTGGLTYIKTQYEDLYNINIGG